MVEPALNIEVEKARSFLGKYSAVTFMAAGKLPASPAPKTIRAAIKQYTLVIAIVDATAPVAESISVAL